MIRTALRLSALLATLALGGRQARADYLYTVSGLPAPTISGQSIVVFTANPSPNHALPGTANHDLTLGNAIGFSTNTVGTDHFHVPFTLTIDFADPAHPASDAVASIVGTLDGNLGKGQSSLTLQFAPQSASIDLAGNPYTVSIPATSIALSGDGSTNPFGVHVQYNGPPIATVPEPSALLLAAFGVPLLSLVRRRKRSSPA
jgi:PEP-CTERM motif